VAYARPIQNQERGRIGLDPTWLAARYAKFDEMRTLATEIRGMTADSPAKTQKKELLRTKLEELERIAFDLERAKTDALALAQSGGNRLADLTLLARKTAEVTTWWELVR
jgi:hypothetical protein